MRKLIISLSLILLSNTAQAERFKKFSDIDEPLQSMLEDSITLQEQQNKTLKDLLHEIRLLRHAIQESSHKHQKIDEIQAKLLEQINQALALKPNKIKNN